MRRLLDQGIPRDAGAGLRELGFDCAHASERGMSQAADEEIVEAAARENCVIVTLDADFHAILAVTRSAAPSVIRLRIEGLVTIKARKTTCHLLPVGN